MSAWLCPHTHIDALVQQLAVEKIITLHMATDVGRQLLRENIDSLHCEYPTSRGRYGDVVDGYTFHGIEAPLDVDCVYAAARSYLYQTCEDPTADGKPGWKMICELIEVLENDMDLPDDMDGFDRIHPSKRAAGWLVTDLTRITARRTS